MVIGPMVIPLVPLRTRHAISMPAATIAKPEALASGGKAVAFPRHSTRVNRQATRNPPMIAQ